MLLLWSGTGLKQKRFHLFCYQELNQYTNVVIQSLPDGFWQKQFWFSGVEILKPEPERHIKLEVPKLKVAAKTRVPVFRYKNQSVFI